MHTYKVMKNTGKPQTAFRLKKSNVVLLRKNITKNQEQMIKPEVVQEKLKKPTIHKGSSSSGRLLHDVTQGLKNNLDSQNDNGASTVSLAVSAGGVGIRTFKAAQTAAPVTVDVIKRTSKGVYQVGKSTVRVISTVDKTATRFMIGELKLNAETLKDFKYFTLDKSKQSAAVKKVVSKIQSTKQAVRNFKSTASTAKRYTANTVKFVDAVLTGTVATRFTKDELKKAAVIIGRNTGVVASKGAKGLLKTSKGAISISGGAANVIGDALNKSDDTGVQALSMGIKTAQNLPGVSRTTGKILTKGAKTIKTATTGTIKTTKNVVKTVKYARANGTKQAARKVSEKAVQAVAKAGHSVVTALLSLVQKLSIKVLLPVILICAVVAAISSAVSAPINVVLNMFGGIITFFFGDGSDTSITVEMNVDDYIAEAIDERSVDFSSNVIAEAESYLISNGGNYHVVRIYKDDVLITGTDEEIMGSLQSLDGISSIIKPIFNTLVFSRHDMQPSQDEASAIIDELWGETLTIETEKLDDEYCGNIHEMCGIRHAAASCPNSDTGTHSQHTCTRCDYYSYHCDGHSSPHTDTCADKCDDLHLIFHTYSEQRQINENSSFGCSGYTECKGHKALAVHVKTNNINVIMKKYFLVPIAELEGKAQLTEAEKNKLSSLKSNYDICLTYISVQEND